MQKKKLEKNFSKIYQKQFEKSLERVHEIFRKNESLLNKLSEGITHEGPEREILDEFLEKLGLEKTPETYYASSVRIGYKKFEPLDNYLEKNGKTQEERDRYFEDSFVFVSEFYQKLQEQALQTILEEKLLTDFYSRIFSFLHEVGILHSQLFLSWNRKLMFENGRELEERFENDTAKIMDFLKAENLFDQGNNGDTAERCYSLLVSKDGIYESQSYAEIFPDEVGKIVTLYKNIQKDLGEIEDEVYGREKEYIAYFHALECAWKEADVDMLVTKWNEVDITWMAIDTPVQPGHPMEYYEDQYRKAVGIEFDLRLCDDSLFTSTVNEDIHHMYESMYDEIGKKNFPESYEFSLQNQKRVQLHIGSPVLQYAGFLCGAYSAQVVPNDGEVSKIHGKKIFAFPKFVLESYRTAPKMKLEQEILSEDILKKYYDVLHGPDERYYKIYDIETIGHEYGHTLWLTSDSEVQMNQTGLFKNIEEFKATAGGLVAYFFSAETEYDEEIVVTHLMRCVKMMRYREVLDVVPYYCECLIHLHIFFESGMASFTGGQIQLHYTDDNYEVFKNLYIAIYTQQIFTYLNHMDAGNFLFEFVVQEKGFYFPKNEQEREFVETYYERYKDIGNEVL